MPYETQNLGEFDTVVSTLFLSDLSKVERYATIAQINNQLTTGGKAVITTAGKVSRDDHKYWEIATEISELFKCLGYDVKTQRNQIKFKHGDGRISNKPIYVFEVEKKFDVDTKNAEQRYTAMAYLENGRLEEAKALYSNVEELEQDMNEVYNTNLLNMKRSGFRDSDVYNALREIGKMDERHFFNGKLWTGHLRNKSIKEIAEFAHMKPKELRDKVMEIKKRRLVFYT